jgi:hypothetical protein
MKRSPSNSSHEFWSSAIGSKLFLEIIEDDDCPLSVRGLIIEVVSVAKPIRYKLTAVSNDGSTESIYHYRKEALCIVKHDWMAHYKAQTAIRFEEHKNVDLEYLIVRPDNHSPREWVLDKWKKISPRRLG